MRHYLLFVASPAQIKRAKEGLRSLDAEYIQDRSLADCYRLHHRSFNGFEVQLHLLGDLNAVIPHLRQYPVDLMIYDERMGGVDAVRAMDSLRVDVEELTSMWGPDFHFPLSRAVVILDGGPQAAEKTFRLGRDHIRDVMVAPRSFFTVLRWIGRLLQIDLQQNQYKVGCAMSGGGLEGFLYQIGCAWALEKAFSGRSLHECDIFSGISSGSLVTTALAAHVPIDELIRAIHGTSSVLPKISGSLAYDFAFQDIGRRLFDQSLSWGGLDINRWVRKAVRSIPTGFFRGEQLRDLVRNILEVYGREDRFSDLSGELYIGATNQDSFSHVVFGREPWNEVPVSEAVRASCALPPFFTPGKIDGQYFIDGLITRTCNLELTIREGCNLVFIIDPMRPHPSSTPGYVDKMGGWYTLIQTVKTLVHTRFRSSLSHLAARYHHVDFMIFQPYEECAEAMSGSPMKYRLSTRIIDLAFKETLQRLRERHPVYVAKLAKYGFQLASQRQLLELERKGIDI
ncbi:MAG: patatin-like phospholipase family protein [Deltaproteobacteria bacterium]|nr:patatin-like phospholipase family protein [Deltaproteobacteria bacterium]